MSLLKVKGNIYSLYRTLLEDSNVTPHECPDKVNIPQFSPSTRLDKEVHRRHIIPQQVNSRTQDVESQNDTLRLVRFEKIK